MKTEEYTVQAFDTLSGIAVGRGISWEDIYDLPENTAFRTLRPDPNFIVEGDKLFVPLKIITEAQRDILRHALGMESFCCNQSRIPKGLGSTIHYGRRWKKPSRNRYLSDSKDADCQRLVTLGFLTSQKLSAQWVADTSFVVTDLGRDAALKGIVYKKRWGYDE